MSQVQSAPLSFTVEQIGEFTSRFYNAFVEVHDHTLRKASDQNVQIPPHYEYPSLSIGSSGFPTFSRIAYQPAPRNYGALFKAPGLLGAFLTPNFAEAGYPAVAGLAAWMEKQPSFMSFFGPELSWTGTGPALDADRMSRSPLHQILANGVDRYINLYGLGPLSKASVWHVLGPLITGMVSPQLSLSLVVPIALTRFALSRFRLSPTCYVLRLPQNLQLARADAVTRPLS